GQETVAITVSEPVTEILLNAAELAIQSVSVQTAGGEVVDGTATLDEAAERARLLFPSPIPAGEHRLTLRFTGILNDRLHGFYRSTYKDASGVSHVIAATQFEATDARRGFPCWDEPALKAVFGVTLVIPEALVAVSNARVTGESPAGAGRKAVAFADTIRMSTYLVAFVVGDLEATDPVMVGATPLRVWCVPGSVTWPASPSTWAPSPSSSSRATTGCRTRATSSTCWRSRTSRRARWRTSARSPIARPRCWSTRRSPPTPSASASRTWWPTRSPTCGLATSSPCCGGTASGSTRPSPPSWSCSRSTPGSRSGSAGPPSECRARPRWASTVSTTPGPSSSRYGPPAT